MWYRYKDGSYKTSSLDGEHSRYVSREEGDQAIIEIYGSLYSYSTEKVQSMLYSNLGKEGFMDDLLTEMI